MSNWIEDSAALSLSQHLIRAHTHTASSPAPSVHLQLRQEHCNGTQLGGVGTHFISLTRASRERKWKFREKIKPKGVRQTNKQSERTVLQSRVRSCPESLDHNHPGTLYLNIADIPNCSLWVCVSILQKCLSPRG